jgi:hypothetical protein
MARKDSLKMAQHFEMAQQKCVQRFAVFDRSAVGPLGSPSSPNRAGIFVRATVRVMPAHSRRKNGVASLAYVTGIHVF